MKPIVYSLEFAKKVNLYVEYSTLLEEIDSNRTYGQIIRRLKRDGLNLSDAIEYYTKAKNNIKVYREMHFLLKTRLDAERFNMSLTYPFARHDEKTEELMKVLNDQCTDLIIGQVQDLLVKLILRF